MCGICGVVGLNGADISVDEVRPMMEALKLRGPDDEGQWTDGVAALGHRRLSIIDIAGGHQPIGNEDGTVQVVFNGEIYDFTDVRKELEDRGHEFRTQSDSEVLVHGWEVWGDRLVDHIQGMFAFALWDGKARTLFLARDRFGKKPLYWYRGANRFVFASTLSALLKHPAVPRTIDQLALERFLAFGFVPAPETILASVNKIVPGGTLLIDALGEVRVDRYFRPWSGSDSNPPAEDDAAEEIRRLVIAATKRRLVADVPVGVFLSGGIDSSSIVAAASRAGAGRIKTFSLGFSERSYDETDHARIVAREYGTDHTDERIGAEDLLAVVPKLGEIIDEPLADGSIVPTYLLSRLARKSVTVVLGGDGGDELFGGYPTHLAHRVLERLGPIGESDGISRIAERLTHLLPVSHESISLDFKFRKTIEGMRYSKEYRNCIWFGNFPPDELPKLLGRPVSKLDLLMPSLPSGRTYLDRVLAQDLGNYLVSVLTKLDRASMACSLEVRSPLLDTAFARYAMSLPIGCKFKGLRGKAIFRRAMRPWLPKSIIDRPKHGFGMPIGAWLQGSLKDWSRSLLLDKDGLAASGMVVRSEAERLLNEHASGVANHRQRLWSLLVLEMWRRQNGVSME